MTAGGTVVGGIVTVVVGAVVAETGGLGSRGLMRPIAEMPTATTTTAPAMRYQRRRSTGRFRVSRASHGMESKDSPSSDPMVGEVGRDEFEFDIAGTYEYVIAAHRPP